MTPFHFRHVYTSLLVVYLNISKIRIPIFSFGLNYLHSGLGEKNEPLDTLRWKDLVIVIFSRTCKRWILKRMQLWENTLRLLHRRQCLSCQFAFRPKFCSCLHFTVLKSVFNLWWKSWLCIILCHTVLLHQDYVNVKLTPFFSWVHGGFSSPWHLKTLYIHSHYCTDGWGYIQNPLGEPGFILFSWLVRLVGHFLNIAPWSLRFSILPKDALTNVSHKMCTVSLWLWISTTPVSKRKY